MFRILIFIVYLMVQTSCNKLQEVSFTAEREVVIFTSNPTAINKSMFFAVENGEKLPLLFFNESIQCYTPGVIKIRLNPGLYNISVIEEGSRLASIIKRVEIYPSSSSSSCQIINLNNK